MEKRCVLIGTGARSNMYIRALTDGRYKGHADLVAICDINQGRMDYYNELIEKKI